MTTVPSILRGLCDDAAILPPESMPLSKAVPAHVVHRRSDHGALMGAFVIGAAGLVELPPLIRSLPRASFGVSVTVSSPDGLPAVVTTVPFLPPVRLRGLEVGLPAGIPVADVVPALNSGLAGVDVVGGAVAVYVDLPAGDAAGDLLAALEGTPYGVRLRLGPGAEVPADADQVAAALVACARRGVFVKVAGGLRQAVRTSGSQAGSAQHGVLNLLLAAEAAAGGAPAEAVREIVVDDNAGAVTEAAASVSAPRAESARQLLRSFDVLAVGDLAAEFLELGLVQRRADATT